MQKSVLRIERFLRDLSQARLGEVTGLGQHTISRIERGVREPKPEERKAIAWALGVDSVDLWPQANEVAG